MVFIFQYKEDAERFYKVLPKRLEKYGLKLHEAKSSIIRSGKRVAEEANAREERIPTYKFLGFVCYWGKSRSVEVQESVRSICGKALSMLVLLKEWVEFINKLLLIFIVK